MDEQKANEAFWSESWSSSSEELTFEWAEDTERQMKISSLL